MNYLQPRKKKDLLLLPLVLTISIVGLLILAYLFIPPFKNLMQGIASPFFSVRERLIGSVGSEAYQKLQEENTLLRLQLLSLPLLEEENTQLKELFGRVGEDAGVLAVILKRPSETPYDTFIIDVGSEENISVGARVRVQGETVLGEVVEVYRSTSKVSLFSTPGRSVDVLIGPEGIAATAEGQGEGNFKVTLPRGVEIEEGNEVVLPNISPKVFGVVGKITGSDADPFQTILFKNPVNLQELNWVEVL